MTTYSKDHYERDLQKIKNFLPVFFRNPWESICTPLILPWQSTAITLAGVNFFFGLIHGLYRMDLIQWLISFIITPLMAVGFLLLISLFLSYFVQYMFHMNHEYDHISSVLFWAYIPSAPFFMLSLFYPPLYLLGLLVLAIFVIRGLIENFKIPKNTVVTLVTVAFLMALIFWVLNEIYGYKPPVKPKSLDQLENEIQS